MTCRRCKVAMKECKGHIYHKQRKWKCPKCARVRMQKPEVTVPLRIPYCSVITSLAVRAYIWNHDRNEIWRVLSRIRHGYPMGLRNRPRKPGLATGGRRLCHGKDHGPFGVKRLAMPARGSSYAAGRIVEFLCHFQIHESKRRLGENARAFLDPENPSLIRRPARHPDRD